MMLPPQNSTLAQLTFGPATQQTIVTTTTTTTVSLPPLIIQPPRDLAERDPKQFPLIFSPTPTSIKRFCFDVNGKPTMLHEVEDVEETLSQHRKLQETMRKHNGTITREEKHFETPIRTHNAQIVPKHTQDGRSDVRKRSAAPSIAEAAEMASMQRQAKRQRSRLHRALPDLHDQPLLEQSTLFSDTTNFAPVTPDAESSTVSSFPSRVLSHRLDGKGQPQPPLSKLRELKSDMDEDITMAAAQDDDSQIGPPFYRSDKGKQKSDESAHPVAVATPPIGESDISSLSTGNTHSRPVLPTIITGAQQDASLPSPSLSPVTAAANIAARQAQFDASFADESASVVSGLDLEQESKTMSAAESQGSDITTAPKFHFTHGAPTQQKTPQSAQPTIMDIPTMVDAFDSMPEALQSYVMYQLLRRSTKSTLQMVANVVNPALKCDPFTMLPPELSSIVTRYLDAKSMSRAAQVSRRWRRLINSDERAWKDLLDQDDFVLPPGEIARAVKEGWGWQYCGESGWEEDLSRTGETDSAGSPDAFMQLSDDDDATSSTTNTSATTRSRRKARTKQATTNKTKRPSRANLLKTATPHWKRMIAHAQGPNGYATAAVHAVPQPTVGLESLRSMHLFKSLYQRHHMIRKSWMDSESQPQHLAFRAHDRHVVTCLLFDDDKILTGSDDTKINVFDTKTGALRTKLEGHEGGVWALQYEGDTLVSGSTDRSVRIWDIKTGRCLQVFQGHTSTVRCLVILKPVQVDTAPDGTPIMMPKEPLIITGSRDSTLRVWKLPQPGERSIIQTSPPANDRDNPYFLRTLSGHHNSVRAIAAHGDTLVSGSYDCTVRVWRISTGEVQHRLQGHTQKVYSVVLDHKRNRCISGSMDNLVKVWDLASGTALFNLEGHTSLVGLLDLSHDRLVSAAADSTLRVWDPESGVCKATLSAHTGAITCFQHDGQKVISGSDRTLKMWNVRNGECVRDLLTELSGVWQVRFDERRCVAAVQRNNFTYIEVLDFGASRDGIPATSRGRRMVVNTNGQETDDFDAGSNAGEMDMGP
ncbi:hypothetical protein AMS68_004997 [Peltaster fructicola]|uniref:F-box domain-containing protein n=1 Tax=Peltaster fructicola TaxID=286661 RepID=A0A6H0XYI7_9PEZI|nr:hypothetical protein AMS68_004997 [Peltaster fructicola]